MNRVAVEQHSYTETRGWRFSGQVQGVGFRPHVWRVATDMALSGEVYNDGDAACVVVQGDNTRLDAFLARVISTLPPRASVTQINEMVGCGARYDCFAITDSLAATTQTHFPLDTRTCDRCFAEVMDLDDRRAGYVFTNCMDCGPRHSIVEQLPYDRASTSMADFPMCDACQREYLDPSNRRFHAQPIACPACGPQLAYWDVTGKTVQGNPMELAIAAIADGKIVAVKGLGGFHLVCDATNESAVATLRRRKQRPRKPLAVMVRDEVMARQLCDLGAMQGEVLSSPENPIVVLPKREGAVEAIAPSIAPRQSRMGLVLPTTPLHQLMSDALNRPLVLTSGNLSGEPPCIDSASAVEQLASLVDGFVVHDRPILNRLDDSVVLPCDSASVRLRTARGYAPGVFGWPAGFSQLPGIIGVGAHLKNTVAVSTSEGVLVSPQVGNLDSLRCQEESRQALDLLLKGTGVSARTVAVDCHPDYASTKQGRQRVTEAGTDVVTVQHHHAHLAACLFENGVPADTGSTLGVIMDGMGLAENGDIWGGEWLLGGYRRVERVAWLRPRALLGGERAMRNPWRNLVALLADRDDAEETLSKLSAGVLPADKSPRLLLTLASQSAVSPSASSAGRLIDAMAALLVPDLQRQSFEGEAGMALEALARRAESPGSPYRVTDDALSGEFGVDFSALVTLAIDDLDTSAAPADVAWRLLAGFADGIAEKTRLLAEHQAVKQVVLSGGVFQNPLLLERVVSALEATGLRVLTHRRLSASDENIALGQVAVAAAQMGRQ